MELIGIVLPFFIDIINRKVADEDVRRLISLTLCFIVGIFINYVNTVFVFLTPLEAFNSISASILLVLGASQLSFLTIYRVQLPVVGESLKELVRGNEAAAKSEEHNDA